jgi:plasmid stabilization system protein ParE
MVRWSYTSKADLLQIYNYIAKDSIYYAKKKQSLRMLDILMMKFSQE